MTSTHSTHDGSRDLSGSLKHSLAYLLIKTEHRLNGRVADAEKEKEREREGCVVEASITASDTCQSTAQLHAMSSAVRLTVQLITEPARPATAGYSDGWLQQYHQAINSNQRRYLHLLSICCIDVAAHLSLCLPVIAHAPVFQFVVYLLHKQ